MGHLIQFIYFCLIQQFLINNQPRDMVKNILVVISILFILTFLGHAQSYQTYPIRTKTVNTLCASFPNRYQIVSASAKSEVEQYYTAMKASFSVTGTQLISTALTTMMTTQNPGDILTAYPNLPQEYGLFVAPFALCLIILCFTCMCACCCCCCPAGCPPCGCCRKPMGQPYSKCELVWPAVVLILSLGLILAAGAIGLSKSGDLQTTIQAVGCSVSIAIDDLINGNVTQSQKVFIGIKSLSTKVSTIKNSLATVSTQFSRIGSDVLAAGAAWTTAKNHIDLIPNGFAGQRKATFNYLTPFDASTAQTSLPSSLPQNLGSTASGDAATPIYLATAGIQIVQDSLNTLGVTANTIVGVIGGGTFSTALDTAKTTIDNVTGMIQSGDKMYFDIYSQVTPHFPIMNTAVTGVYAGLIGIACLGIVAALFLVICNMYKCRFLLYFTCCILILVGIVCLFLAIIISALLPIAYFTCDFTTTSFSSAAGFNANIGSMVPSAYANYTSVVTSCLPGQSGDFLQSAILGTAGSSMTQMRSTLQNISSFDAVAINTQIDNLWNPIKVMIEDSYSGKILDFSSSTDQTILNRISLASNYPSCSANAYFNQDSWIPTAQAGATISCKGATNTAVCTQTQLQGPTIGTCFGCMSAGALFKLFPTLASSGTNFLSLRYSGCTAFITELNNINTAFYSVKQTNYPNIITRLTTSQGSLTVYKSAITTIGATFASIQTNLNNTVNMVTDQKYGILAGMNCAIFGQDINLIIDSGCIHGFKILFFIRAAFGIAGFGVLFSMYCASCTGARHFKQSQAKSKASLQKNPTGKTDQTLQDLQQNTNRRQNVKNNYQNNTNMQQNSKNVAKKSNNFVNQKDYATRYQQPNQPPYY